MLRVTNLAALAAAVFWVNSADASATSASTVRGQLVVSCKGPRNSYDGRYEYRLAGKIVSALGSECSPGSGTSHISIEQVFQSPASTTLLLIEGVSAQAQTVRVLHISSKGAAFVVDTLGGDGFALVQKSPTSFRLIAPGGGFAMGHGRKSTWTCTIDLDFRQGSANGNLAVPYEPGLPNSICEAEVRRLVL